MVNRFIFIQISQNGSSYGNLIVSATTCLKCPVEYLPEASPSTKTTIYADGIFTHFFVQELHYGPLYRKTFAKQHRDRAVQVELVPADRQIVDINWNRRLEYLIRERCELDHTLSWLSTLGGAFSALGDYFLNCAEMAGKISVNQLKLALRLNDPSIVARCRLYLALSLIQRRRFRLAKRIIYVEYMTAKKNVVIDIRLINMCRGIWCKLKYERELYYKRIYEVIYHPRTCPSLGDLSFSNDYFYKLLSIKSQIKY